MGAYGKEFGGQHLDDAWRAGVPKSRLPTFKSLSLPILDNGLKRVMRS
jgi:hypothetical protein